MAFCTEIHETCTGSIISILLSANVHETCTGSIISFFSFFSLGLLVRRHYILKKD